jgi:glycerate dehydrogenase
MRIVILDGYTLNPGDLDWEGFRALGELIVYDRTATEDIVSRCKGAGAVLTNKTPLDRSTLSRLPELEYIGVLATGHNIVDSRYALEKGITVTNVPGYGTDSVVQLTFALLMEPCLHVQHHSDAVHEGRWSRSPDFCFWELPLTELSGKTMGIIGYGTIGKKVGKVATAFGMKVLATGKEGGTSLDELLRQSDVVSIHCPLTSETRGLVNSARLRMMRPSSLLLNTSRGPIIVEKDLADALEEGMISGAGLDVLSIEPPCADNPLLRAPRCIITPHIAWATREARGRLLDIAVGNLASFINGKPVNRVER